MEKQIFKVYVFITFIYMNIILVVSSTVLKTRFEPLNGCQLDQQFTQNITKTFDVSSKLVCGRICAHTLSCQSIHLIKGTVYTWFKYTKLCGMSFFSLQIALELLKLFLINLEGQGHVS